MVDLVDLATPSIKNRSKKKLVQADLKYHADTYVMYPPFFEKAKELPNLEWKKLVFPDQAKKNVPDVRGVYAFAIDVQNPLVPPTSYITYIGLGGKKGNGSTLKKRFTTYIRNMKTPDRVRIAEMLDRWKSNLTYYYAVVDDNDDTEAIEETLLSILIPPYNRGDFSAELKSLLQGANIVI